jgi:hypothetical protein
VLALPRDERERILDEVATVIAGASTASSSAAA